jgi:hypothetical protein
METMSKYYGTMQSNVVASYNQYLISEMTAIFA